MRTLRICAIWLICGILLGYAALSAVFCIQSDRLAIHATESVAVFKDEAQYQWVGYHPNSMLDNLTDAMMLETACYAGEESALQKAVFDYRLYIDAQQSPSESFVQIHEPGAASTEVSRNGGYARYWHGYLLLVRPLLALCDYATIRTVNRVCQCLLLVLLVLLLEKRARLCTLPYIVTVLFFMPRAVGSSLQYSSVAYVTQLALAALLLFYPRMRQRGRLLPFFLLVGMLTSYLDLLTFPTVSLTMPLCVLCILERDQQTTWKHMLRLLLQCCIAWGAGYAGMWAGKWLIVLLAQGQGFFGSLREAMALRLSSKSLDSAATSRIGTLIRNFRRCFSDPALTAGYLLALAAGVFSLIKAKRRPDMLIVSAVPYIFLCCIPVLWIVLLCNHAAVHVFYTYRTLVPILFILLVGLKALASSKEPRPFDRTP